jgi:putative spermidine/putrescine transport system ATP-binding protein
VTGSSSAPAVRIRGVVKRFEATTAVAGIDLDIAPGEFFTMLGPSGSGKTTLLRMIAGFELPDEGTIELGRVDATYMPANARDVNTVFQDYALFPHMDVITNVAYGLRVAKVPKADRAERARAALEIVQLTGYETRRPSQLSGGQRQRVALARAIVNEPEVLLLDEPLGALDLKLRQEMQVELKAIQRKVGITFVYVTHDQEEALTMSDRVAVMSQGRIQQVDTPFRIYERPANEFVAGFIGVSNLFERDGQKITVRPEKIRLLVEGETPPEGFCAEPGTVDDVVYLGMVTRFHVALDGGGTVVAVRQNLETQAEDVAGLRGRRVTAAWQPEQAYQISTAGV